MKRHCWNHAEDFDFCNHEDFKKHVDCKTNAILICCGEDLILRGFTNTCRFCNADYNMSGMRLAPREFWGEETQETISDILRIK